MDKALIGVIILIGLPILVLTIIVLRFVYRIYTRFRDAKRAVEDAMYNHQSKDYTGRRAQQYHFDEKAGGQRSQGPSGGSSAQPRRTQTESGEVIIDHRHQERENKKIFDDSDGEYVDFTEE